MAKIMSYAGSGTTSMFWCVTDIIGKAAATSPNVDKEGISSNNTPVTPISVKGNPPANNSNNNPPASYSGKGNGPGCPDLPGKLSGGMKTSKIPNAYGGFVQGNVQYIAKLENAYDNFLTKIRSITVIKNGMKGHALIGDSLRAYAFQKQAYDEWVRKGSNPPNKANPCKGYHVAGQAVDLDQGGSYTTLAGVKVNIIDDIRSHGILYKCLYDAGLRRIPNEWWHWQIGESDHPINFKFVYYKGSPADKPNFIRY